MYYYQRFAPKNTALMQASTQLMSALRVILPNLLLSLLISIVGSLLLTLFAYWMSAIIGFPIMPFFLVII